MSAAIRDDKRYLSNVSKMPGSSISRDARLCHVGSKLRNIPGSTCSKCYALKGMYNMPNVREAMARREDFFHAIDFVPRMVRVLNRLRKPEFRWFDSGDVEDERMADNILDVCEATPNKMHWIPTREKKIWRAVLRRRSLPDNVTLRVSAAMIDGEAPVGFENTSTVSGAAGNVVGHLCPAPTQDGKCGSCRACWSRDVKNVTYGQH